MYAELGRSLYETGHFSVFGGPVRFYTLVVPLLVGGPLSLGNLASGYLLLKGLQSVVMSLAAVPVYLWGRSFLSPRLALLAAALTLAIPGLVYSGLIMTEVAFYPIGVLTAWALARALAAPTLGRQVLALGAIVLAVATRLQALVLVPALVAAVGTKALLDRNPQVVRRFVPSFAGIAALVAAWSAWQLREGGPATDVLGAYRAAGETSYTVHDAALFVLYHAGDLLLMTGLFPVCAAALLVAAALREGEPSNAVRAFLAVTVCFTASFVVLVGIFASEHVGRLAERDLLALLPLLFLAFALWLQRGAPRPPIAASLVALAAFLLVLVLPMGKVVSLAAIPDAFTLIPLYRLHERAPSISLELVVNLSAGVGALLFLLVPRRRAWALPVLVLAFLALTSFSAGRVVTAQATLARHATLGPTRDWVDRTAPGPVAYLYGGQVFWNAVWENAFWNRKVTRFYDLLTYVVPGPLPQQSVGPYEDGRLVDVGGRPIRERYMVAGSSTTFRGSIVASAPKADLYLWRVEQPARLDRWTRGLPGAPGYPFRTEIRAYACKGGALRLELQADAAGRFELRRNGVPYRRFRLARNERWSGVIPARARRPLGRRVCSFGVLSSGPVSLVHTDFFR